MSKHRFRFHWRDDFHVVQNRSGLNPTLRVVWHPARVELYPRGARIIVFVAALARVRIAEFKGRVWVCLISSGGVMLVVVGCLGVLAWRG